jgi:TonB family protein
VATRRTEGELGLAFGALASLVFHGSIVAGWVLWRILPVQSPPPPPVAQAEAPPVVDDTTTFVIDLPLVAEGVEVAEGPSTAEGDVPVPSGGSTVPRMDTRTAGQGGDPTAAQAALNLSDGDEGMTLTMDLMNRLDRQQVQRMHVSRKRQSWEDWRATTNPMELAFVQTGAGRVERHRAWSPLDPSRGAMRSLTPGSLGAKLGATFTGDGNPGDDDSGTEGAPALVLGGERLGSRISAPGTGLAEAAAGIDHRASAPIASARPDVARAPVSVPANVRDRPSDDTESDQEVARTVQSLVHASTAGGPEANDGRGGTSGGGDPGAGATTGVGSRAGPLGVSDGDVFEIYSNDPRLMPYFRAIKRKIDPLWANAFPKSAIMDLKQGMVILEFTVNADGSAYVSWPPLRPSGIDEFDRNCADAIRRAAPFGPIPPQLGRSSLRIRAPFVASNPVVR